MEEEKPTGNVETSGRSVVEELPGEDGLLLPGFRFHPTDEELVGFYLRRKVEGKPLSIEIIKEIDMYKYDPWDLPRLTIGTAEREWYFFCLRRRKYRNSIRPNRVTGSGFWKATGIDRPVYSSCGNCMGLKKSLVYYVGSAGKATKTDWMMHEFRHLPRGCGKSHDQIIRAASNTACVQEAEIWTICRIFKRNVSAKYMQTIKQASISVDQYPPVDSSSKSCSMDSEIDYENEYFEPSNRHKQGQLYMHDHANQCESNLPNNPYHTASASSSLACPTTLEEVSWEELGRIMETPLVYWGQYV